MTKYIKNIVKNILNSLLNKLSEVLYGQKYDKLIASFKQDRIYKAFIPIKGIEYFERPELGSGNLFLKKERVKTGGPFEWPNIVALNQAICTLIKDANTIVNIGSGTGTFEWFASVDKSLNFIASEYDRECVEWCNKNRKRSNIIYCTLDMESLLNTYGKFDLALSVDVIEHIKDYSTFLKEFSMLSDRAIITTPNKDRNISSSISKTPEYFPHVREWDAGEFYWILKNYYCKVELFSMPNEYQPILTKIGLMSTLSPIIALCNKRL